MTLSALHGPNAHLSPSTLEIIKRGGFKAIKLFTYNTGAEIKTLESAGVTRFLMRSQDSVWRKPNGSKYIPSFHDYGDALLADIVRFYPLGIKDWQIDCEPNVSWKDCPSEYSPWIYRAFLSDVLGYVMPKLPEDVRIGSAPMSFSPQYMPNEWLDILEDVFARFHFLCANCYWQSSRTGRDNILAGPLTWGQFGANFTEYHKRWPDKPVMITEYGNSIHERHLFTPAQVDAFRAEQYPLYLEWLRGGFPYVEAAYCWISPTSTQEWSGFELTPAVATAMWPAR